MSVELDLLVDKVMAELERKLGQTEGSGIADGSGGKRNGSLPVEQHDASGGISSAPLLFEQAEAPR
ncbi:MAG: hypothetical protein ACM32O_19535, partial [Clostridia bacterium]